MLKYILASCCCILVPLIKGLPLSVLVLIMLLLGLYSLQRYIIELSVFECMFVSSHFSLMCEMPIFIVEVHQMIYRLA